MPNRSGVTVDITLPIGNEFDVTDLATVTDSQRARRTSRTVF